MGWISTQSIHGVDHQWGNKTLKSSSCPGPGQGPGCRLSGESGSRRCRRTTSWLRLVGDDDCEHPAACGECVFDGWRGKWPVLKCILERISYLSFSSDGNHAASRKTMTRVLGSECSKKFLVFYLFRLVLEIRESCTGYSSAFLFLVIAERHRSWHRFSFKFIFKETNKIRDLEVADVFIGKKGRKYFFCFFTHTLTVPYEIFHKCEQALESLLASFFANRQCKHT